MMVILMSPLLVTGLTYGLLCFLGLAQRDLTAAAVSMELAQQRAAKAGPVR
jgi:hypothetical protein